MKIRKWDKKKKKQHVSMDHMIFSPVMRNKTKQSITYTLMDYTSENSLLCESFCREISISIFGISKTLDIYLYEI